MDWRSRSFLGWTVGGVPILVSMLQALSGMMGRSSLYWVPIVGDVSRLVVSTWSLAVAQQAVSRFYTQQTIVFSLFLLITLAWIVQGALVFTDLVSWEYARVGSGGTVVLAAILYGFLFVGVYGPILTADIPVLQRIGFFAIPVAVIGALGESFRSATWEEDRRKAAIETLSRGRDTAKRKKQTLDSRLSDWNIPTLLEGSSTSRIEELREEFVEDCDSVIDDAKQTISDAESINVSTLEDRAASVETRAENLSPEDTLDQIKSELTTSIKNSLEDRFSDLEQEYVSRFDRTYKVENLPSRYRKIDLDIGSSVTVSSSTERGVKTQLRQILDEETLAPDQAIGLLDQVDEHIHRTLLPRIEETESEFHEIDQEVEQNIERAKQRIERIGGYTAEMLESVLVTGDRGEKTDSVSTIEQKRTDARERLHSCRFDEALDDVRTAREMSEELLNALQFVRSVLIPALEDTDEYVRLPPASDSPGSFLTEELFEKLREPLGNDYGVLVTADLDDRRVQFDEADVDPETTGGGPQEPESGPTDSVLFLLREFRHNARENTTDSEVSIQLGEVPSGVLTAGTVPELTSFLEDYEDLEVVDMNTVNDDSEVPSEGYITLNITGGKTSRAAFDNVLQDYRKWHERSP